MLKYDVVIATYNGENYIREQIESILNQTLKPCKIIIRDDMSTDSTLEIIYSLQKVNDNIFVVKSEENVGYINNFSILSKESNSEVIFFSDQDDVWHKDKAKIMLYDLQSSNADLIFSNAEIVDEELLYIDELFNLNGLNKKGVNLKSLCSKNFITGATMAVREDFLKENLPFPNMIPHDMYLGLTALLDNKLAFTNKTLIKYRQHGKNVIGVEKKGIKFKINNLSKLLDSWAIYLSKLNFLFNKNSKNLPYDFVEFFEGRVKFVIRSRVSNFMWILFNLNKYYKYVYFIDFLKDVALAMKIGNK